MLPLLWLAAGLLASYLYMDTTLFSSLLLVNRDSVPVLPVPLFPPQAIILSVLLLTPTRRWWVYLLAYYALQVAQGEWNGLPRWYALLSNVANVVEPLIGAALFRRLIPQFTQFTRLREVGTYVGCVVLGSVIGASWGAAARAIQGFPFWISWPGWFLGDALASLVLAPTIVLWACVGFGGLRARSVARATEAVLLYGGLLLVGWFVFGHGLPDPDTAPALALSARAAAGVGGRAVRAARPDERPFPGHGARHRGPGQRAGPALVASTAANVLTLQLFLLGVGVPLFILAALVREREDGQAELEQSEARYHAVVSNFPHGVVLLFGPDSRHTFADGQGLPELGLSLESVEGKSLWEAFPPEVAAALAPRYQAALAGADASFELVQAGRTYQTQVLPVSHTGAAAGMVVMQDVTEQRRAELLAELDRAKTTFFNNVSHEFRTPLTLLLGPLEETLAAPPERLAAGRARAARDRRTAMGCACSSWSTRCSTSPRSRPAACRPSYVPTDLAAFTAELASIFRSAIEHAGLELRRRLPAAARAGLRRPRHVGADRPQPALERPQVHLRRARLLSRCARKPERVVLTVRDTGTGIPAEEVPHLFERFHRVQGAAARTQEGTGIGLALVQELVRLHGGTVGVTSVVGEGSTFTVAIPRGAAHLPDDRIQAAAGRPRASAATAYVEEARSWLPDVGAALALDGEPEEHAGVLGARADGRHRGGSRPRSSGAILVADDNADTRAYLVRLLRGHGAVRAVGDGAAALARRPHLGAGPDPSRRHDARAWTASRCSQPYAPIPDCARSR